MEAIIIEGNKQRLDGGAMFGHVPKALWSKWMPADENNCVELATRALLLKDYHGKNLLFDVGVGTFFSPELKKRYGIFEEGNQLSENLNKASLTEEDIDGVILSHLHFDHAGGLLAPYGETERLLFPNATIYLGKKHWERAKTPHRRERASFLPHLHKLLAESNRLTLIDSSNHEDLPGTTFHFADGHTPGLMISEIETEKDPLVFISDLVPALPWLHLPVTMGYDRFPEKSVDEKAEFLPLFMKKKATLVFPHDPTSSTAKITQDEKGKFSGVPTELYRS